MKYIIVMCETLVYMCSERERVWDREGCIHTQHRLLYVTHWAWLVLCLCVRQFLPQWQLDLPVTEAIRVKECNVA